MAFSRAVDVADEDSALVGIVRRAEVQEVVAVRQERRIQVMRLREIVGVQASRWVEWARMINSTANIAVFGIWSYALYREFRYRGDVIRDS